MWEVEFEFYFKVGKSLRYMEMMREWVVFIIVSYWEGGVMYNVKYIVEVFRVVIDNKLLVIIGKCFEGWSCRNY